MEYHFDDSALVGKRIKLVIKEKNMSIDSVASAVGISRSQFRKLLNGEYCWRKEMVYSLADYLGVDVSYFATGRILVKRHEERMDIMDRFNEDIKYLELMTLEERNRNIANMFRRFADIIEHE